MIRLKRKEHQSTELAEHCSSKTGVFVSKSAVYLFSDTSEIIKVWWKIDKADSCLDWIGLFDADDSSFYLDQKSLRKHESPAIFTLTRRNVLNATDVYFGLIDGMSGRMLARSNNVHVCKSAALVIHDIQMERNLRVYLNTSRGRAEITRGPCVTLQSSRSRLEVEMDFEMEDVHFTVLQEPEMHHFDHFIASRQLQNEFVESKSYSHCHVIDILFSIRPLIEREEDKMDTASSSSSTPSTSSSSSSSTSSESPWTMYVDVKKRKFYVNHETKETRWSRPDVLNNNNSHVVPKAHVEIVETQSFITPRRTVTLARTTSCPKSDLLQFIQRDDFKTALYENREAMQIYNQCSIVRHALHRIQHGLDVPSKFESQPLFVRFVNTFADRTQPLPDGWQTIEMGAARTTVFVSHSTKTTTHFDPRIRHYDTKSHVTRRGRSVPSRPSQKNNNKRNALFDEHALIQKCDELRKIAHDNFPQIAERIHQKLMLIERFGGLAVASLANDLDITLAMSVLETSTKTSSVGKGGRHLDGDNEKNEEEEANKSIRAVYERLNKSRLGKGPHRLCWRICRERLLDDAFRCILNVDVGVLKRSRLQIRFDGELALDYGGLSREFFILVSRELFHPKNGYFEYEGLDYHLQLRGGVRRDTVTERDKQWVVLCGRVLALSVVHRCYIDVFFTDVFYKCLLKRSIVLDDFRRSDGEFHKSMTWILENDVDCLDMSFVTSHVTPSGSVTDVELLPGGQLMKVDNQNKTRFVELMCEKKATRGVEHQLSDLLTSFHQVLPVELLAELQPVELKRMLGGSLELDLNDWRANTVYKGGYSDTHIVVDWFWHVVETMTNQERFDLLLFVTGSSSVPFEGFSALRGNDETSKFCVEKWGDATSLPRAHTCFNRLQLPSYNTKQTLRLKLQQAIQNGMSYSIE